MNTTVKRAALLAAAVLLYRYMRRKWGKRASVVDKVVLITGGANGIGREAAFKFAKAGARVVLWDIDAGNLAATKRDIEGQGYAHSVITQRVDMSSRIAIYAAAEELKREVGFVFCVVNNCGVVSGDLLLDIPDYKVERTFNVNTLALIWTTKAFLPAMLERNSGHIVAVASVAGFVGAPKIVDYAGSKFAARGIMEALRTEIIRIGATGVHTSCICPGHVATNLFQGFKTIIPTLSPQYVAQRILEAVQHRDILVILPMLASLAIAFKNLIPIPIMDVINRVTGATTAMDNFRKPAPRALASAPAVAAPADTEPIDLTAQATGAAVARADAEPVDSTAQATGAAVVPVEPPAARDTTTPTPA